MKRQSSFVINQKCNSYLAVPLLISLVAIESLTFVYIVTLNADVWRAVRWGRRESVTNDVTDRNHIWPPSAVEKDQDSMALVVLLGIIIYGKWDSCGGYGIDRKK